MHQAPVVIGIKQFADWNEAGSVEATLAGLGNNTGNMMFTQALLANLAGARWGSFGLGHDDLEGRDAIVIACANWINGFEDFGWLADRLEKTSLPVVLVGIGAQSTIDMTIPEVNAGTLRLLNLAKDRSTSISARGAFTREVLEHLGIKNAEATGCPSMLLAGQDGPSIQTPQEIAFETTCLHATRHGVQPASALDKELYRLAFRERMDIVLQSETPDIYCALGREAPADKAESFAGVLQDTYGTQDLEAITNYLREHGRVFTNVESWISYMKTKKFCFGTRIHGTLASLVAGTAATLIAHDSRTLEMAQAMSIPFVQRREGEGFSFDDLTQLVREPEFDELRARYAQYRRRFADFFAANSLALV